MRAYSTIMVSNTQCWDAISLILLHEEAEVETDRGHFFLFSFIACLKIFVISPPLMPIRLPSAPPAEQASWM